MPNLAQARAKKDAKQLAAASLLEILLETVPFQDLLYKSVKQQQLRDLQVRAQPCPLQEPSTCQLWPYTPVALTLSVQVAACKLWPCPACSVRRCVLPAVVCIVCVISACLRVALRA